MPGLPTSLELWRRRRRGIQHASRRYTFQTAGENSRSRGATRPSFASCRGPRRDKGAGKAGRRLAPADPCARKCTRGGSQVSPDRPAFPARMVLTVSFVLSSGSVALLPPSPRRWSMREPVGRRITARLDASLRASGPHDFSVRARLRWESGRWRVLAPEAMRRRCQRRVVRAKTIAHGQSRPAKANHARRRRVHRCPTRGS
jgi:hypothetical protein